MTHDTIQQIILASLSIGLILGSLAGLMIGIALGRWCRQ